MKAPKDKKSPQAILDQFETLEKFIAACKQRAFIKSVQASRKERLTAGQSDEFKKLPSSNPVMTEHDLLAQSPLLRKLVGDVTGVAPPKKEQRDQYQIAINEYIDKGDTAKLVKALRAKFVKALSNDDKTVLIQKMGEYNLQALGYLKIKDPSIASFQRPIAPVTDAKDDEEVLIQEEGEHNLQSLGSLKIKSSSNAPSLRSIAPVIEDPTEVVKYGVLPRFLPTEMDTPIQNLAECMTLVLGSGKNSPKPEDYLKQFDRFLEAIKPIIDNEVLYAAVCQQIGALPEDVANKQTPTPITMGKLLLDYCGQDKHALENFHLDVAKIVEKLLPDDTPDESPYGIIPETLLSSDFEQPLIALSQLLRTVSVSQTSPSISHEQLLSVVKPVVDNDIICAAVCQVVGELPKGLDSQGRLNAMGNLLEKHCGKGLNATQGFYYQAAKNAENILDLAADLAVSAGVDPGASSKKPKGDSAPIKENTLKRHSAMWQAASKEAENKDPQNLTPSVGRHDDENTKNRP